MACRCHSAASLAGLVLVLAFAGIASASPPGDHSAHRDRPERSLIDGIIDTPLEYDQEFKGGHQHGGADGHLPGSSRNVDLVGKLRVSDARPGRVSDVATLGSFAYLGAFGDVSTPAGFCGSGGVYVVDISNPSNPREVNFIPATPGSFVGEGVQALRVNTASFRGDLLVHNNEGCAAALGTPGGMSIYDVTDPRAPKPLALHVGDTDTPPASPIHSVFAWQQGSKAYAVQVDDIESGEDDVDIFDITDPSNPEHVAEVGLPDWPAANNSQSAGMGNFAAPLHHDVQVRNVGGNWRMLLSYWDAGYIVLDVNDPTQPKFIEDSDFPDPDSLTGARPPEGNAHYAEWDRTGRYILAADEDFDPFRQLGEITSGPFAREKFSAQEALGSPSVDRDSGLVGPTVFVGGACDPVSVPAAPPNAIALIERGPCPPRPAHSYTEKALNVQAKGYRGAIVFNSASGADSCEATIRIAAASAIPVLGVVPRSLGYKILGVPGYNPGDCPDADNSQPPLPAIGARGSDIDVRVKFDGWGYMRLLDGNTLAEVDAYAIPEALDERFAEGFGDLSIHETAADPTRDLAYLSYYSGGLRVMAFGPQGLSEVGHYIDDGGNNFWGVEVHVTPDGQPLVLASDRDYGLYILRYRGAPSDVPRPGSQSPRRAAGRCANRIRGSNRGDRLRGTPAGDRIDALGGSDTASGLGGDDCLDGRHGRDRLLGGGGGDRIVGGPGGDRLSGGAGRDRLLGSAGDDNLKGDGGNDRLYGGPGSNRYNAGSGNDYINAVNGRRERVDCGEGRDRVRADRTDRLQGCERIARIRQKRRR